MRKTSDGCMSITLLGIRTPYPPALLLQRMSPFPRLIRGARVGISSFGCTPVIDYTQFLQVLGQCAPSARALLLVRSRPNYRVLPELVVGLHQAVTPPAGNRPPMLSCS